MGVEVISNEEHSDLMESIIEKEKQERIASASSITETLSQLNISIENLPQKCQQLLEQFARKQIDLNITYDPTNVAQQQTRELSRQLDEEYKLLELKQKNQELRRIIEQNNKIIEGLKRDIEESKEGLMQLNPNPENIQEHIRQTKQKLASYETNIYEKAKAKFASLQIPPELLPSALLSTASRLEATQAEARKANLRAQHRDLAAQAAKLRAATKPPF